MITNKDRSGWFGASDANIICGSWDTKTFMNWWMVKMGVMVNSYSNAYMEAGNILEHSIIDKIAEITGRKIKKGKRPIYDFKYRLRVNYDGLCENVIEVKTTQEMYHNVPLMHRRQTQILMFKTGRDLCEEWVYELLPGEHLKPYYLDIDPERLKPFYIDRDDDFIDGYLDVARYLKSCLKQRKFPNWDEFNTEAK